MPEVTALEVLRARWRFVAIACATAMLAAAGLTLVLPRRYTAVCRILIEPPGGSDVRVTTAISPVYLESLRSYELIASGDELFARAADRFGLRRPGVSLTRLKNAVLKVDLPRNTKVLEIYATLPDGRQAHALAFYLAEQTVELSRGIAGAGDAELVAAARNAAAEAEARAARVNRQWAAAAAAGSVEQLKAELEADLDLRSRLERDLFEAEAEVTAAGDSPEASDRRWRARRDALRKSSRELNTRIDVERKALAAREVKLERAESERREAEAQLRSAATRLNEVRASVGYRGERLSIIDRGTVPDRPSFPNLPLNVAVALLAGMVLSLAYVFLAAGYRAGRRLERQAHWAER